MNIGLTVVTHTKKHSKRNISKCVESVKNALPKNSRHIVIEHQGNLINFMQERHSSMKLDDIVVFVDDDDYISEESLSICLDALTTTEAGIAFTYEISIMENGTTKRSKKPAQILDICKSPTTIHHLVAYRTKYITDRSLNLALKYGCGIEWAMKVDAIAASTGAVFIPIDGYYWVHHDDQNHRIKEIQDTFRNNIFHMGKEMGDWFNVGNSIIDWGR